MGALYLMVPQVGPRQSDDACRVPDAFESRWDESEHRSGRSYIRRRGTGRSGKDHHRVLWFFFFLTSRTTKIGAMDAVRDPH